MLRLNSLLLCCKLCSVLSFDHIWVRPWWDPFLFFIKVCGPQNCHSWLNHLCLQVVQQLQVCNAIYYRAIGNQAPLCEPWQQLPSISRGPWFDFWLFLLPVLARGRWGSELCSAQRWISVHAAQQFLKFFVWWKENPACFWLSEAEEAIQNQVKYQVVVLYQTSFSDFFYRPFPHQSLLKHVKASVSFSTILFND